MAGLKPKPKVKNEKQRRSRLKSTTFDERQKPLLLGRHKVQRNRKSKLVILPKLWADANGIEVGDKLDLIMERDGTLSVRKYKGGS